MSDLLATFAFALLLTFVACCVASAALQIIAWTRHARPGVRVSFRGLSEPEGFFDKTGVHQVRLSRRLVTVGGVAYLTYGVMLLLRGTTP